MDQFELFYLYIVFFILLVGFLGYLLFRKKRQIIKEYYSDNKLRRKYFLDKKGLKQGADIFYYRNKRINKIQKWSHDSLEGDVNIFYPNGNIYLKCNYLNNMIEGKYIVYDEKGEVIYHVEYECGLVIKVIQSFNIDTHIQEELFENESRIIEFSEQNKFDRCKSNYNTIKKNEEKKVEENSQKGILTGLVKIGKVISGVRGFQDRESSKTIKEACEDYYKNAQDLTEHERNNLNAFIRNFGKYRLDALQGTTGRFLGILKDMKKENLLKEYWILKKVGVNVDSIQQMEAIDMNVSKALLSTAKVGALSVAAAMGTPTFVTGTVSALATASTGTAISTLSGAAATNATLAWLGGGSLATGGGGVAVGATVLSGLTITATAGVGIAALGIIASKYYAKKLTEVKEFQKNVEEKVAQMESLWDLLLQIEKRTFELTKVTHNLEIRILKELKYLEPLSVDYDTNNEFYNCIFQRVALLAKSMSELAQTPLLDSFGNVSSESSRIIKESYKVLNSEIVSYE